MTPSTITSWDKWLPHAYDYAIYINHQENADLKNFDMITAWNHYEIFGENEGRVCNQITRRSAFIELIPSHLQVLEIGPFFSPALKRPEREVYYLDCYSKEEMAARASSIEGSICEDIPTIDYVWSGQKYAQLVDRNFPLIFSSHNIEHQHCLITHLQDIESILEENGAVFLVIPDKRYCFDHFFPESTVADIIDAWSSKRTKHRLKDILDHHFFTTHNDAKRHWNGDHGNDHSLVPFDQKVCSLFHAEMEQYRTVEDHVDVHVWKFTPKSFKTALENLLNLQLTNLRIIRLYPTIKNSNEFYAVLSR